MLAYRWFSSSFGPGLIAVFALASLPVAAGGQATHTGTATVVVFTPGGHWRGFGDQLKKPLFAKAKMTSMGFFFDGDRKVAWLPHSRYLVLQTPAGAHTFMTVMSGKEPDAKTVVPMTLEADGVSYLALTATVRSYGVASSLKSNLTISTCSEFAAATSDTRFESVQEKDIEKPFRAAVLTTLPSGPCS